MPNSKAKEPTPEERAKEAAAKLRKQQAEDQLGFEKALANHQARCDRWRKLWDKQIDSIMAQEAKQVEDARRKAGRGLSWRKQQLVRVLSWFGLCLSSLEASLPTARTYDQIAAELAQEAKDDVESLDREIFGLVTRSGMVFSATTLLFAVFALRSNNGKLVGPTVATVLLTTALLFAAIAFVSALVPFWTRILRAWREPYHPRAFTTLLRNSSYDRWVWYTWLGDRRTPVSQKYKKAHSVVVPMLIGAAILIVPGLGLSLFF